MGLTPLEREEYGQLLAKNREHLPLTSYEVARLKELIEKDEKIEESLRVLLLLGLGVLAYYALARK